MDDMLIREMMVIFVFVTSMIAVCVILWQVISFHRSDSSKKKTGVESQHPEPKS